MLGIIAFFIGLFGGVLVLASGGFESMNLLALGAIAVVVGIVILLYVLLIFFVQFYGQAIVLDDFDAIDGLKRSASVVRHHLVSTLGYAIIGGILGGLLGGVAAFGSLLLSPRTASVFHLPEPALPLVVLGGLVVLGLTVLLGGFFSVYSVAFYRALTR